MPRVLKEWIEIILQMQVVFVILDVLICLGSPQDGVLFNEQVSL